MWASSSRAISSSMFTRGAVFHFVGQLDRGVVGLPRASLGIQVIGKLLGHVRTDADLVQLAYPRRAFEEQDAGDVLLGMLHLLDGPFLNGLVQLLIPPVVAHFGVDHVLG